MAEAAGIEVGAEIGEEEVGEDVGSRRLAGAKSRQPFGGQTLETSNYRERSLPPDVLAWPRRGPVLQLVLPEMQQHPSVRQKSGYFGVIAIVLIVTVALCWGLTHI